MVALYSVLPCVILTNMGGGAGVKSAAIIDIDADTEADAVLLELLFYIEDEYCDVY